MTERIISFSETVVCDETGIELDAAEDFDFDGSIYYLEEVHLLARVIRAEDDIDEENGGGDQIQVRTGVNIFEADEIPIESHDVELQTDSSTVDKGETGEVVDVQIPVDTYIYPESRIDATAEFEVGRDDPPNEFECVSIVNLGIRKVV